MCFYKYINDSGYPEYVNKVSEENIVCYKEVFEESPGIFRTSITYFMYEIGKTYTEERISLHELNSYKELYGGVFHSYTDLIPFNLNGMASHNIACPRCKSYVMKCIIPAGTPYWENGPFHEYASTAIKPIEILDPDDLLKHH